MPAVTFPAADHHHPLAGTKLFCLVTEAHRCEQLAQSCYTAFSLRRIWTHDLLLTSPSSLPVAPPRHLVIAVLDKNCLTCCNQVATKYYYYISTISSQCQCTDAANCNRFRTHTWSVLGHGWAVQYWLNRSKCYLGVDSCGPRNHVLAWGPDPWWEETLLREGDMCRPMVTYLPPTNIK